MSDRGAALFIPDAIERKTLVNEAIELVSDPATITKLEVEVNKLALPDSAVIIADEVLKLVQDNTNT